VKESDLPHCSNPPWCMFLGKQKGKQYKPKEIDMNARDVITVELAQSESVLPDTRSQQRPTVRPCAMFASLARTRRSS
jgi:hypothetical protein